MALIAAFFRGRIPFPSWWFSRSSRSDAAAQTDAGAAPSSSTPFVTADRASLPVHSLKKGVSSFSQQHHEELSSLLLVAKLPALYPEISQRPWCFPLAPRNAWWNAESVRWCIGNDGRVLNAKEMLHCQESKQTAPQTKLLSNVDLNINSYFLLNIKSICDWLKKPHNTIAAVILFKALIGLIDDN